jgi:N-acetylneuraminic acid mutarotase
MLLIPSLRFFKSGSGWIEKQSAPFIFYNRGDIVSISNGTAYAFTSNNNVYAYNINNDSWVYTNNQGGNASTNNDVSSRSKHTRLGNNSIIQVGFRAFGTSVGSIYIYDPVLNSFYYINDAPDVWIDSPGLTTLSNGHAFMCGGLEYAIGILGGTYNTSYTYNWSTNSWTQKANMPEAAGGQGTAALSNGCVFVCGGTNTYIFDSNQNSWIQKNAAPMSMTSCVTVAFANDTVLVCCSIGSSNAYLYTPSSDTWTQIANTPGTCTSKSSGTLVNNKAVILAGMGSSTNGAVWIYS